MEGLRGLRHASKAASSSSRFTLFSGAYLSMWILCALCAGRSEAITTYQDSKINITGLTLADILVLDYDRDGWDDILVAGETGGNRVTLLYRNINGQSYTMQTTNLVGLGSNTAYAWSPADPQGNRYLLGCGLTTGGSNTAYVVSNNAGFGTTWTSASATPPVKGVDLCGAGWVDYNNDQYPDFVVGGSATGNSLSLELYTNDADGTFSRNNAFGLTSLRYPAFDFADYNHDGYVDLFMCGHTKQNAIGCGLYRNNAGSGAFPDSGFSFTAVTFADVEWGDYNNDGWADILVSGATVIGKTSNYATVYRNNMGTSFTDINPGLVGTNGGSVDWGDFDNDGFEDIFISGQAGSAGPGQTLIYRNIDGSGVFQLQDGCSNGTALLCSNGTNSLPQYTESQGAWLDYNKDGFLDLALLGPSTGQIFTNVPVSSNTVPDPPPTTPSSTLGFGFKNNTPDHVLTPLSNGEKQVNLSLNVDFPVLVERDPSGAEIRRLELGTLTYIIVVTATSISNVYQFSVTDNGITIFFKFYFYQNATMIEFGGNTFSLNSNTDKWSVSVTNWPFADPNNTLELHVKLTSLDGAFAAPRIRQSTPTYTSYILQSPNTQVWLNLIKYALDGDVQIPVTVSFPPDVSEVILTFPYFRSMLYDPDISVLIATDNGNDDNSDGDTNLALLALVSIVVPVCCLVTAGVGAILWVTWYLRNRRLRRLMNEDRLPDHVNFGPDGDGSELEIISSNDNLLGHLQEQDRGV